MAFSLNHAFVFLFIFIGVFAILVGYIPSAFFNYQPDYVSPTTQDKEVADYFSANQITLYEQSWSFNISLGEMAYNQSGLPDGHQVEFHFDTAAGVGDFIQVRHAYPSWLFGWWLEYHVMEMTEPYASTSNYNPDYYLQVGLQSFYEGVILWENLELLETNNNASYFEVACEHITQNFVVLNTGDYATLEDSFDAGELTVLSSYSIDFEAMKPSAWTLVAQLLTFQSPDLGLPEPANAIISYLIAGGMWAAIALLIFALITAVIPTIGGWVSG